MPATTQQRPLVSTSLIRVCSTASTRIREVDFSNLGFGKVFSDHMFVAEYDGTKWTNMRIMPYGKLMMSPAMSALHYGQAIFEGLKAFRNDNDEVFVFRPWKNAQRLNESADRMCMPDVPEELFLDAITELVSMDRDWIPRKEGESLYIRPVMFATDEYVGVRPSETYMFFIFTCPVGRYYSGELKVKIENKYTRASKGGTGHSKAAGNYAASLWPTKKAQEEGYNQILWTDGLTHEYFEESGTMNVVFRAGNVIMTPMITDSILDGVTRDSVLTLARDWGYQVEERRVSVKEITDLLKEGKLDEAFGVGTAATVAPIRTIGYQGTNYDLRPSADWEFAPRAQKELDLIKQGLVPDTHDWILRIP
ncbi:MAG: branched-chain amino acid aminotransferase [Flavobacteriales bacterium]|nr:branched-chain amino acid aminotransferase [Flavobacteriales bacterium]